MKQGWEMKNIGDVSSIVNGGTPKTSISEYWGGEHLWITPKDMGKLDSIFVDETGRMITDEGLKNSSAKLLPINSIILSSRAPIGHLAINKKPISTNQGCKGIIPSDEIDTMYLYYFLKNSVKLLNELGSGTTFKELSGSKLSNVQIPLPPLDEQKRIVAKLDQCFEAIDKARANVERNRQNAKELFQSRKNDLFKKLEEDVSKVPLPSVCDEIFAGGDATKGNYSKEKAEKFNIPIFANAVKDNGLYGYTNLNRVSKPSITIAARGSGTGHTEIRYEPFFPIVRLIVITPKIETVNLEFLKYSIQNFDIMRSGSAIPQLTVPMIKGYSLPLPTLMNQKQIVNKLDDLKSQTQSLESNYLQELDALDELKKSILQKAFNGEL